MANRTQISILVDDEILAEIDAEKDRAGRSRNWVIGQWLKWGRKLPPLYGIDREGEVVSKKIAEVSLGGVAQEDGGNPGLPAGGKAQFPQEIENLVENASLGNLQRAHRTFASMGEQRRVDAALAEKNRDNLPGRPKAITGEFPRWSEARMREMADAEPGGLMACSPEILGEMLEQAKIDGGVAATLHLAGIELDREILVRWGLAENYTPKMGDFNKEFPHTMEETFGSEKELLEASVRAAGASTGRDRKNNKANAEGSDVDEAGAVGVGKPKVDLPEEFGKMSENLSPCIFDGMPPLTDEDKKGFLPETIAALRDICKGNIPVGTLGDGTICDEGLVVRTEVDLCGFESYNDVDGENYVCGKEKHGPKIKHGEWIKI